MLTLLNRLNPQLVFRFSCLGMSVICLILVLTALYFQYVLYLDPCPMCMVQRYTVAVIGLIGVIAFFQKPAKVGRIVYSSILLVFALLGSAVAGRHVYLQLLPPDRIPECFPGLNFILATQPFLDALKIIFGGTGECAETQWTFLGLSIPGWTLVAFISFAIIALFQIYISKRSLN